MLRVRIDLGGFDLCRCGCRIAIVVELDISVDAAGSFFFLSEAIISLEELVIPSQVTLRRTLAVATYPFAPFVVCQ